MLKNVMGVHDVRGLATILAASLLATLGLSSVFVLGADAVGPQPGDIVTIAGGLGSGSATNIAQFTGSFAVGSGGRIYVCDGQSRVIRSVDPSTGNETVIAGASQTQNYEASGIPANSTPVYCAGQPAIDPSTNNLAFGDFGVVRLIAGTTGTFFGQAMTAGDVYTVAGNGNRGYSGDGGPATSAQLSAPAGAAFDSNGNLLFADPSDDVVRVVAGSAGSFYGQAMTAGDIYTIAGNGSPSGSTIAGTGGPAVDASLFDPSFVTLDHYGNVVISNSDGMLGPGIEVVAESTASFYGQSMTSGDIYVVASQVPVNSYSYARSAVAVDAAGNLLVPVERCTAQSGPCTTTVTLDVVAESTGTFYGQAMTAGDVYQIAGGTQGYSGDGGSAISASLNFPGAVAVDPSTGNILIADLFHATPPYNTFGPDSIRVIAESTGTYYGQAMTAGDIYTIVGCGGPNCFGDGTPALGAELGGDGGSLQGVAVDGNGNYVLADDFSNTIRVVAQSTGTYYGQAMTAGDIYTIAGQGGVYSYSISNNSVGDTGIGGPATSAVLYAPWSVTVDHAGNVIFGDTSHGIYLVAESTGTFYGQSMTAGDIYSIAGTPSNQSGYSGDGGPATSAQLSLTQALAVDPAGNLILADSQNARVRVVAESTGTFYGQAMTAGYIYTIAGDGSSSYAGGAGGAATSVAIVSPTGVAFDSEGNLIISDGGEYDLWVLAATTGTFYGQSMTSGHLYLIAGIPGSVADTGDGVPATSGTLFFPLGIAVDPDGNVLVDDNGTARIRIVAEHTGVYYGQAMTAGDLYTVAGNGIYGYTGDGPATQAELVYPNAIAVNASGDILIADAGWLREVIAPAPASLSLAQSASVTFGSAQDTSVTITGSTGAAPSGTVHFSYIACPTSSTPCPGGTVASSTSVSLVAQSASSATARTTWVAPAAGTYCLAATYSGDSNYHTEPSPSDGSWCFSVDPATPQVTVTPTFEVGSTQYDVAVSGPSGVAAPSSTVSVSDSASGHCSITLAGGAGACSVAETPSTTPYTITASYAGDGNYQATQKSLSVLVRPIPTLSVTPAANPATSGPVAYAVHVSGSGPTPTGEVVVSDGATGTCTAVLAGGVGGCSITESATGSPFGVVAQYQGDANYSPAQAGLSEVVAKATPSLEIAPTSDPADGGDVGYVVLASGKGPVPTGQVSVSDSNGHSCSSSLPSGIGLCTLDMGSAAGTYTITATYGGDANYASATQALTDGLGSSDSPTGTASANAGQTTVTGSGEGSVNVLLYEADPVGPPSFSSSGVFFDVAASQDNTFSNQVVQDCNLNGGNQLLWWDSSANDNAGAWEAVVGDPGPTYSAGPPACLTVTIDANSSPTIAQLTGTVFAVGSASGAPQFASADNVGVASGASFSTTVLVSGYPTPSIHESGTLPPGVTFHDNGNGTATIKGNPGKKLKTYPVTLTTSNSVGTAHETFFVVVGNLPVITSKGSVSLKTGKSKSVVITTKGSPAAQLGELGALPPGLAFRDTGNGKATISGTPTAKGTYSVVVMADNLLGSASQTLTISVR